MAGPTITYGTAVESGGATSTVMTYPTTTVGDYVGFELGTKVAGTGPVTAIDGSTVTMTGLTGTTADGKWKLYQLGGTAGTTAPQECWALRIARATGSEGGTTVTATHASGGAREGVLYTVNGADPSTMEDSTVATGDSAGSSLTMGATTTNDPNALIVTGAVQNAGLTTNTGPVGYTVDLGNTGVLAFRIAHTTATSAGLQTAPVFSWGTSARSVGLTISYKAAPALTAAGTFVVTGTVSDFAIITSTVTFVVAGTASGGGASGSGTFAVAGTAGGQGNASSAPTFTVVGVASLAPTPAATGTFVVTGGAGSATPTFDTVFAGGVISSTFFTNQVSVTASTGSADPRTGSGWGVSCVPNGSGFSSLTKGAGVAPSLKPWFSTLVDFRCDTLPDIAATFDNLFEVGNTVPSSPRGEFTVYWNARQLWMDFEPADKVSLALPADLAWHTVEAHGYMGDTVYHATARIDGGAPVYMTSPANKTPTVADELWIGYPAGVLTYSKSIGRVAHMVADTDPGWIGPSIIGNGSGSGTFAVTGTASDRANASSTVAFTVTGSASTGTPGAGSGTFVVSGTASSTAPAAPSGTFTVAGTASGKANAGAAGAFVVAGTATPSGTPQVSGTGGFTVVGTASSPRANVIALGNFVVVGAASLSAMANAQATFTITGLGGLTPPTRHRVVGVLDASRRSIIFDRSRTLVRVIDRSD